MVDKFQPRLTSFTAIPSLSTVSQQASVEMFNATAKVFSDVSAVASQVAADQKADEQNEIKAQAENAFNDSLEFSNKQLAANISSDFNKAANSLIAEFNDDPAGLQNELISFAKGQSAGINDIVSEQGYLSLVGPKIDAYVATAQKKGNQVARAEAESSVAEALVLKQEEVLSLDFSVAQSQAAMRAGVAEFTALISGLDTPESEKLELVSKFQKNLIRKSTIDLFRDDQNKKEFIGDLSDNPIEGLSDEENKDLVKTLLDFQRTSERAESLRNEDAEAQQRLQSSNIHADLRIAINNPNTPPDQLADLGLRSKQLREDGVLSPEQSANLEIQINNRLASGSAKAQSMSRIANALNGGTIALDPKNKDDIQSVDNVAETILGAEALPGERETKISQLVNATGIIPTQVRSSMRAAARTTNPDIVAQGADIFARLQEASPDSLDDMTEREKALFSEVTDLVRAGLTKEEAVERARELTDIINPAVVQERMALIKESGSTFGGGGLLDNASDDVNDIYEQGFFNANADFSTASVQESIVSDYKKIFTSHFIHRPDAAWAKEQAAMKLKRKWNVTNIDGSNRLMAFPPEQFYGLSDGDNEWIKQDFMDTLGAASKQFLPVVDLSNAFLTTDTISAREANTTGKPKYNIMYIDTKDGMIKQLVGDDGKGVLWQPDVAARKAELDKIQEKQIAKSRRKREVTIQTREDLKESLSLTRDIGEEEL